MGLLYTGSRLFPITCVVGYRRVPDPPARMMPLYGVLSLICLSSSTFRCVRIFGRGTLGRIMRSNPLPVASAGHAAHPLFVFKIPAHGLANATLKCLFWLPSQYSFDLTGVHCITPVVARTIFHKRDQVAARA